MGAPNLHPHRVAGLAVVAVLFAIALMQVAPRPDRPADAVQPTPPSAAAALSARAASPGELAAAPAAATAAATELPVEAPATPPVVTPEPSTTVARRGGIPCASPHRTVRVSQDAVLHARPNGPRAGRLPARSAYLGQPMNAWVQQVSRDGRWGKVTMPWAKPVGRAGWVRMAGLSASSTRILVVADLSERALRVYRGCSELFMVQTAIGRPGSPSPRGRYWVTDRVAVPAAQQGSFGTFAFGLSTVQPNLPAGWTGGDQMAIHGTGAPGSIGQAASAGCLRVSEDALDRLQPLLRSGTPVVIQA